MRHMGEPKGKTRICPRCHGAKSTLYDTYSSKLPCKMYNKLTRKYEDLFAFEFIPCPYCAGLGYKEDCY